jgi:hypothetical protein
MFFFLLSRHIRGLVFGLMLLFVAGSNISCFVDDDETDDFPLATVALTAAVAGRQSVHLPRSQASGRTKTNPIQAHKAYPPAAHSASGPETSSLPLIVPLRT